MITQITDYLGYAPNLFEYHLVVGKKIDIKSLIHYGMIVVVGNTYSVLIRNQHLIDLPDPERVRIADMNNWIYTMATPSPNLYDKEDNHDFDKFVVGTYMDEDLAPPHPRPTQKEITVASANRG